MRSLAGHRALPFQRDSSKLLHGGERIEHNVGRGCDHGERFEYREIPFGGFPLIPQHVANTAALKKKPRGTSIRKERAVLALELRQELLTRGENIHIGARHWSTIFREMYPHFER